MCSSDLPGSTSASVIIPDSNYRVYLHKSVPVTSAVYSAVIVQKTSGGYSVSGYNLSNPFFNIIPSIANGNAQTISSNGVSVQIYHDSTKTLSIIPYGTEYATVQQVADFLVSYQRYLIAAGFTFSEFDQDLQKTRDWILSVNELVYWSQQGWAPGTIIVLNPTATHLNLVTAGAVVDEITNTSDGKIGRAHV